MFPIKTEITGAFCPYKSTACSTLTVLSPTFYSKLWPIKFCLQTALAATTSHYVISKHAFTKYLLVLQQSGWFDVFAEWSCCNLCRFYKAPKSGWRWRHPTSRSSKTYSLRISSPSALMVRHHMYMYDIVCICSCTYMACSTYTCHVLVVFVTNANIQLSIRLTKVWHV